MLFVFILLIGAIIVKYSLLQSESNLLEQTLNQEKLALEKNRIELKKKEEKIKNVVLDLETTQKYLQATKESFAHVKEELKSVLLASQKISLLLEEENKKSAIQKDALIAKQKEITQLVERENAYQVKLEMSKNELEKLQKSMQELHQSEVQKDAKIDALLEDNLIKEKLIHSFESTNSKLEDEIKVMMTKLESTKQQHALLVNDLKATKHKIKSLTGIKIKVISALKSKLGNNIQIDPKNGSLRLASNILFDEGEATLKPTSKEALKSAVYDYLNAILSNEEINQHIDKIVIEGHTNSKGNFLYNLELSQKRAYSVMDFLLTLDIDKKENLRNLIVASGRSFLDPIYDVNHQEDKEASRRIEIKFTLKNEEAIKEIENILH